MKIIVVFCMVFTIFLIEQGVNICKEQDVPPTTIITASIAFFGTELAMCMVKRIFSKEDKEEQKLEEQEKEKREHEKELADSQTEDELVYEEMESDDNES